VFSIGSDGRPRPRRTPGIANLAYVNVLFADGRAGSLEEQMVEPLLSPVEMAGNATSIVERLAASPRYVAMFADAFPGEPIGLAVIARAVAAYERTLVVNDTPYDRWARGDPRAISPEARRGYRIFGGKARCAACHPAPLFGSSDLDPIGTPDRDAAGHLVRGRDPGLERVTGRPEDFGAMRAPSLRAAAAGGPYMHNAVFATLEDVVDFYDRGGARGLGLAFPNQDHDVRKLSLTAREKSDLIAFLGSLRQTTPLDRAPDHVPSGLPPAGADARTPAIVRAERGPGHVEAAANVP
jgi:cytochrome c peroxidase